MEDITDITEKKVCLGRFQNTKEHHDLYVQSDKLILADVFRSFQSKCVETCELDPVYSLPTPGLAKQACLKKTEMELELFTYADTLLMV